MAASTTLKKITAEAKRIRKRHPGKKWITAVKEAGAKYRGGKLGKTKVAKKKTARKKAAPKKKVLRKRSTRRSVGSVNAAVINKSAIKSHYRVALGHQLLRRELATTKTAKKQIGKQIAETRRALNYLT
jgi:adenylate kinase